MVTTAIEVTPQWIADIANRLDALRRDIEGVLPDPAGPRTLRVHWAPGFVRRAGDLAGLALAELPPGRDASNTSVSESARPLGLTFEHLACLADLVDAWLAMADEHDRDRVENDEVAADEHDRVCLGPSASVDTSQHADITADVDATLALVDSDPEGAHSRAGHIWAYVLWAAAAGHPQTRDLAYQALRLDRADVRRWSA